MAGEILSGFDPENESADDIIRSVFDPVLVETETFTAEAISMHDMPHQFVTDIVMTPPPFAAVKTMALFKLALGPEADKLELASFSEFYTAMNAWVEASNRQHRERMEAHIANANANQSEEEQGLPEIGFGFGFGGF